MRASRRAPDELRPVSLERGVVKYAEGSCMVKFGDTHVLVTATLEERLPPWLKGQGRGWVTAEYGMLPRATLERTRREASAGKQGGRTVEIQRLIGRSLRATVDLEALVDVQEVRRGEQSHAQSGRAVDAFQHGADRAFAVGARDVDEAQLPVRIARQRGEPPGAFQPEMRAEQLQAVEKLDGFGVGHAEFTAQIQRESFRPDGARFLPDVHFSMPGFPRCGGAWPVIQFLAGARQSRRPMETPRYPPMGHPAARQLLASERDILS